MNCTKVSKIVKNKKSGSQLKKFKLFRFRLEYQENFTIFVHLS